MSDLAHAVRLALADDLPLLGAIECAAAERYAEAGLPELRDFPPVPLGLLRTQHEARLVWVAGTPPVGFAVAQTRDGYLYLYEIDVHPTAQRHGLGRALIAAVVAEAARRNLPAVTLSTFRDVPWNAPFYARLGFVPVDASTLGPLHLQLVKDELFAGLDVTRRVMMWKQVG